jgi:hypothetical protein
MGQAINPTNPVLFLDLFFSQHGNKHVKYRKQCRSGHDLTHPFSTLVVDKRDGNQKQLLCSTCMYSFSQPNIKVLHAVSLPSLVWLVEASPALLVIKPITPLVHGLAPHLHNIGFGNTIGIFVFDV